LYKRISDKEKIDLIAGHVHRGDICIDIGANVGFYSLLLSKVTGNKGVVFAFEPEKKNFFHLRENTRDIKNIKAIRAAVGAVDSKLDLYVSEEMNVDHHTYDIGDGRKKTSIKMISLDSYLPNNIKPSFIKMDIQGFEYEALNGMRKILKRSKKITVLSEVWPYGMKKAGSSWREYLIIYKKLGFEVKFFIQKPLTTLKRYENDPLFYTDILAIKK
jgi:FkbM family methyltransferase